MSERLSETPILDAVVAALSCRDERRMLFELKALDVMQNRADWLLRFKREIEAIGQGRITPPYFSI